MSKKIIFIFALLILFSNIIFALDTTITPEYNGTQPFVRPMAGGQVHITWSRPSDTTNFYKVGDIFYELQFKKGTDTTWYQYFPGGQGAVADSTSIMDPMTYKVDAGYNTTLERDIKAYDGSPTPNYYGFGVKDYTDTSVTPDLNKHYLIHILTTDTTHGTLFSYDSNVVASKPGNTPNTYFYRIRSRVEDNFNSVEVSPWFPNDSGDSVTVNIFPESMQYIYFYNNNTIDKKSAPSAHSNCFTYKNQIYWAVSCFLFAKNANSYVFSYNTFDPDTTVISDAFENGGAGDVYNTVGIYKQIQEVFGTVNVNNDGDAHISIVRMPLISGTLYSGITN